MYALNGVSLQASLSGANSIKHSEITFRTSLPPLDPPENVRLIVMENKIILLWEEPEGKYSQLINYYEIEYKDDTNTGSKLHVYRAYNMNATFADLLYDTQYIFKVRAVAGEIITKFSSPVSGRTSKLSTVNIERTNNNPDRFGTNGQIGIIIGSAIAFVLIVIILAVMLIIFLRR